MEAEIYDATLLGILQKEGQIAKFLDVVMGFLYRRTDFYHVMKSRDDKLGFPPGVAPRLLIQAYEKFDALAGKRDNSKDTRTVIPSRPDQKEIKDKTASEVMSTKSTTSQPGVANEHEKLSPEKTKSADNKEADSDCQKRFQDNPESHNGAIRDTYRWAQTLTDCDLRIQAFKFTESFIQSTKHVLHYGDALIPSNATDLQPNLVKPPNNEPKLVPNTITKAKQVKVCIKRKHIFASYCDDANQVNCLMDSDLAWDINVKESMWSLIPNDCIHINMEKVQERWWEHVFVEEPKISTQKIEASVPMEHLDDGAQSVIDQLMFDEKQKKLGLPTSKEQKVQDALQKAWNAEGSPFQGTPYDPSIVNTRGNV